MKLEAEALKRFDVTENTFLIGRLHAGSFAHKARRNLSQLPPGFDQLDLYTIPRGEYFYLDGRDNLRGLSTSTPGTEELHSTWEYFIPWFINAHHDFLHLDWQNWYWILYAGAGNAGFDRRIYTDLHSYIPDAGIGFESSFQLRKYNFFIDGIVARALKGSGGLEARISVKSYR